MTQHITTDIAIIGAGVIGLAIAEALVTEGREVVLIDPNPPGSGASYGNAGTIADYAVMPVGTPAVLRALPQLLFSRTSPLSIHPSSAISLAPWLARFMRQSLPAATRRNIAALTAILQNAGPLWLHLAERIGAVGLLRQKGCLYLYESRDAFAAARSDLNQRRGLGVAVELLDPDGLADLEPGLPQTQGGAVYFPDALTLTDPGAAMQRLADAALQHAGLLTARAVSLSRQFDGIVIGGPGFRLHAKKVILAAGAHSRALALCAGDAVPLTCERGYHVEWDMDQPLLNRPVCPTARGFYLCPMQGRLRAAGTVELGGLNDPPSQHRIDMLIRGSRAIFPDLGAPDRSWMGLRPSIPDSLPVIGASSQGADVIHAFGHGHIGLTLAPITARIVADLVAGRPPELDLTPYRPDRF